MLKRNKKKEVTEEKVLDVDASMQGTLVYKDPVNLKINGHFDGKLDTKGNLTIGEHAQVNANVKGENILIAGKVSGEVLVSGKLKLAATAQMTGDITTPSLNVEEGAVLHGRCQMLKTPRHVVTIENEKREFLEVDDVAHYLEVERTIVEQWARSGRIPAFKDGDKWKFERAKIEDWIGSEKTS